MAHDLCIMAMYGDLRLAVKHEGQAGNAALAQATLMQVVEQWRIVTADALEQGLFVDDEAEDDELADVDSEPPDTD